MSDNNTHFLKMIFKRVSEESKPIIAASLRSGAANIGKQLLNLAPDVNQPSDFHPRKLANALKSGIMATGQEMMAKGLDRVRSISPKQPPAEEE